MAYSTPTPPTYKPGVAEETGGDAVFNNMVHSYLGLVQQNPFPKELLQTVIDSFRTNSIDKHIKEILNYEVGYLVAIAIGVVFIILMTLVGLFFSCCRCCGNCGGKMYQKQTKRINCKRRFIYLFLWLITLIVLAGNICAFYSNSKITSAVNTGLNAYNHTADNLQTYIYSVPKEIDFVIQESDKPISKATSTVDNIKSTLGESLKKSIETVANATLSSITNMITVLNDAANSMTAVNTSFAAVKQEQDMIAQNLSDVKQRIENTKSNCGANCSSLTTEGLTLNVSFNSLPDFTDPLNKVNGALNSGIDSTVKEARKTIDDIPDTVKNETRNTVTDVKKKLSDIKGKIMEASNISFDDVIKTAESYINISNNFMTTNRSKIESYDHYRWIAGICLCCVILLVVVCNIIGLLFGPCGHNGKVDPTERSCLSNSSGDFFMAGAGFSFIFAWLLMLVVVVLFIVGGNCYTLICKPWNRNELLPLLDSQLNLSQKLNIPDLSISALYSKCHDNEPVWQALSLSKKYDLNKYLNISQYTGEVNNIIENTNININKITFLDDDQKTKFNDVSSAGIDRLDFTDVSNQIKKNITAINLTAYAQFLEQLANNTTNDAVKLELRSEAADLKKIQSSIDDKLLPEIRKLNQSITHLKEVSGTLPAKLNATLQSAETAQNFVTANMSSVIKNELRKFVDLIISPFNAYVNWANLTITQNMARCGPVANAVDSAKIAACNYIIDSVNAFWFSLGWCTIFFLPSIILSVKLAKYYRRMKSSDVLEDPKDHLEMMSTSEQFLIPRVNVQSQS